MWELEQSKDIFPKCTLYSGALSTLLYVNVCAFPSLPQMKKVPLQLVTGLQRLRGQLKTLVIHRSQVECLEDVIIRCGGDDSTSFAWSSLRELDLCNNSITEIGDSLVRSSVVPTRGFYRMNGSMYMYWLDSPSQTSPKPRRNNRPLSVMMLWGVKVSSKWRKYVETRMFLCLHVNF